MIQCHFKGSSDSEKVFTVKSAYLVKENEQNSGYLQLTNKHLRFFKWPLMTLDKNILYEFALNDIVDITRVFNDGCYAYFCVYLKDNSSRLFRCASEEDQHEITRKIVRMRKTGALRLRYNNTLDPRKLMEIEG
jgi:hypothetical protein